MLLLVDEFVVFEFQDEALGVIIPDFTKGLFFRDDIDIFRIAVSAQGSNFVAQGNLPIGCPVIENAFDIFLGINPGVVHNPEGLIVFDGIVHFEGSMNAAVFGPPESDKIRLAVERKNLFLRGVQFILIRKVFLRFGHVHREFRIQRYLSFLEKGGTGNQQDKAEDQEMAAQDMELHFTNTRLSSMKITTVSETRYKWLPLERGGNLTPGSRRSS